MHYLFVRRKVAKARREGPSGCWLVLGAIAVIGGLFAGGYAIGSQTAPTKAGAQMNRQSAFEQEFGRALVAARDRAFPNARRRGRTLGRRAGLRSGSSVGTKRGASAAEAATEEAAAAPTVPSSPPVPTGPTAEEICGAPGLIPAPGGSCADPSIPSTGGCPAGEGRGPDGNCYAIEGEGP